MLNWFLLPIKASKSSRPTSDDAHGQEAVFVAGKVYCWHRIFFKTKLWHFIVEQETLFVKVTICGYFVS